MYNTHSFSVELATKLGLEKTIILQHFYHWHLSNADNTDMYKDNSVWFFTSRKRIMEVFPYLTERKIRSAIDELVKEKYVKKGNYSNDKMKKTNWYSLTEESLKFFEAKDQPSDKKSNDWSECPTKDIEYNNIINTEKESISKDIPKKEEKESSPKNPQSPQKEKSSAKKKDTPLPFDDEEVRSLWEKLMTYPEWKKKTAHAIELRVKKLERLSKGDVDYCKAILLQTLDKVWLDFYEVKDYKKTTTTIKTPSTKNVWDEMGLTKEQYDKLYK